MMPSKYIFRTQEDDDYGKIVINLPGRYASGNRKNTDTLPDYVLVVSTEKDTLYQRKITDTVVNLKRMRPDKYVIKVIADKNKNGKWDTGDLFGKIQPEDVIPYTEPVQIRAGWDNIVDFDQKPKPEMGGIKKGAK